MTGAGIAVAQDWLALREPADAAARSPALVERLRARLPRGRPLVIHDLAGGTGSMGRWLAPRLEGEQHWVVHDRDAELLAAAAADPPACSADGAPVAVEPRLADIRRLAPEDLADADLVTASALLDLATAGELDRLAGVCHAVGSPTLLTLTVDGGVGLAPPDPLDAPVAAAFNAHQRRAVAGGRLLGPDAATAAVSRFRQLGAEVVAAPSPWRLGPDAAELAEAWLDGWIGAAREQSPNLAGMVGYTARRAAQARAAALRVTVGHRDLLVLP